MTIPTICGDMHVHTLECLKKDDQGFVRPIWLECKEPGFPNIDLRTMDQEDRDKAELSG